MTVADAVRRAVAGEGGGTVRRAVRVAVHDVVVSHAVTDAVRFQIVNVVDAAVAGAANEATHLGVLGAMGRTAGHR